MYRLAGRNILSMLDLSKEEIERILYTAELFNKQHDGELLKGHILASCFFEPSTRTRLSFEAAMHRLGGSVIGFADSANTSSQKGESLEDTLRVIGSMADLIVLRHPLKGAAHIGAAAAPIPLINAGDGSNEHPTQTLVDLFTIQQLRGSIDGARIAIVGDLKYGRTVHSLIKALAHYSVSLHLVSPKELSLPPEQTPPHLHITSHHRLEEALPHIDTLYMTRIQTERLQGESAPPYRLTLSLLSTCKSPLHVLHPLPRIQEIEKEIDETPFACYFQQARNGVPVRMALLALLLGKI